MLVVPTVLCFTGDKVLLSDGRGSKSKLSGFFFISKLFFVKIKPKKPLKTKKYQNKQKTKTNQMKSNRNLMINDYLYMQCITAVDLAA